MVAQYFKLHGNKVRTPPPAYGNFPGMRNSPMFSQKWIRCGNGLMVDRCVKGKNFFFHQFSYVPGCIRILLLKCVRELCIFLLITWKLVYNADSYAFAVQQSWV